MDSLDYNLYLKPLEFVLKQAQAHGSVGYSVVSGPILNYRVRAPLWPIYIRTLFTSYCVSSLSYIVY